MSDQLIMFEQNATDVTLQFFPEALQVTLNLKLDSHWSVNFRRAMRQMVGVSKCEPDTSVNCLSENTCFLVYFQDKPGMAKRLPDLQREIRAHAEEFVKFVLAIPGQQSLF